MRPVLTPAEMGRVDALAAETTGFETLVGRAGAAVAHHALAMLGGAYGRRVAVVAGRGHNGDDGRVAAALLARRGVRVEVVPPGAGPLPACDLVVDAAYGTGFHGEYDAPRVPDRPGGGRALVLAVDVPTGVDATTGVAGERAVTADRTVTFGAFKPGLLLGDGPDRCGEVVVEPIGLPVDEAAAHLVEDADVAHLVPSRRRAGHKWDAAVYVVAGSPGMLGAAQLCAQAAMRAGAGMVRLASPGVAPGTVPVVEAVSRGLPAEHWAAPVLDDLGRCRALVVGPGLGATPETAAALRRLVAEASVPTVVDADGLNVLGGVDELARLVAARRAPLVLTPHDGEYARLVGTRPSHDRVAAARELAARTRATVLLKGATTIVASPSGAVLLATSGSSRLSTAGTGDVLAGVVGALLARGLAPHLAAALGAHVHGRAAARGHAEGLVAGDLPLLVARILSELAAAGGRAGAGAGAGASAGNVRGSARTGGAAPAGR
ncbi:MAG TPA: NAD(P)H-hydrate dehydratase [Acidimicrobiales bacterium]|nr:NAD(P)H-hydrate dehydratase [Acidimicrobiales bacterium]